MESLRSLLALEQWASVPGGSANSSVERSIRAGPFAAAAAEWSGRSLQAWLELGNPFVGECCVVRVWACLALELIPLLSCCVRL